MPNYEFQCQACKKQFMKSLPFGSKEQPMCPVCKGATKRLISAPMVHFKGSGFYKNDSAPKASAPSKTPSSTPASSTPTPAASPTPTQTPAPSK